MDVQLSTLLNSTASGQPKKQASPVAREVVESGKRLPDRGNVEPPKPKPADVQKAVQQIQNFLSSSQRQLQFRVDDQSGRTIITVINPQTKEVVRQIPDDQVLKLAAAMRQQGPHFIDESA